MIKNNSTYQPEVEDVIKAAVTLKDVAAVTSITPSITYSKKYNSNILFKREDLQVVRSYKIRGAYNKISSLSEQEKVNGIVCASAGNHAQGVAYSCKLLKIKGLIYMPTPTPKQKIEQVKMFGENYIKIVLEGDTFDDAFNAAMKVCNDHKITFSSSNGCTKVIL